MDAAESNRFHALDAVRGFALLLGVVLHASMSYLPGPQIWMAEDSEESAVLAGAFFVIHIFRMSLFFLIAGFFARMLYLRRGPAGFARNRALRIALPMVLFWPVGLAGIIGGSILAWNLAHPGQPLPPPPPTPTTPGAFLLLHLWFLYVLLWLYALALAVRAVALAVDRGGRLRAAADAVMSRLAAHPLAAPLLAAPFLISLWFAPNWIAFLGVPPADTNLIVNPQALAAFGTAFGFGWLLNRQTDLLQAFARRWPVNLALAAGLSAACLAAVGVTPELAPARRNAETLAYAAAYGLAIWTWCFALVGLAVRFLSGFSPARRYLADASYWIYLVHLPLLIPLQAVAAAIQLPWPIEFPLLLAAAMVLLLGSYQLLVRYSWIGAMLNGRRARPARMTPAAKLQGA